MSQPTPEDPVAESVARTCEGIFPVTDKITIVGAADAPPDGEAPAPAVDAGLLLHKFVKADSWRGALTADATGENLPRHGSAWIYAKEIVVSPGDRRTGPTSLQITNAVSDRGYFLFPISDDV
jgi:hypothetical protein